MTKVNFLAGSEEYELEVDYIYYGGASYKGECAFCRGYPCGDSRLPEDAPISVYFKNNDWEYVCPICKGAPS